MYDQAQVTSTLRENINGATASLEEAEKYLQGALNRLRGSIPEPSGDPGVIAPSNPNHLDASSILSDRARRVNNLASEISNYL